MRRLTFPLIASIVVTMLAVVPGRGVAQEASPIADAESFSPLVTHPFFPLSTARLRVYAGEELDSDTGEMIQLHIEVTVLPETKTVAGVQVAVVEAKEYQDGELTEVALAYHAQHADGTVYYFGEDVDNYENGEFVDHEGSWLAGEGENQPGVYMPASPEVGQTYGQELSPGVAEDRLMVVAVNQPVVTPVGHFGGCLRTQEYSTLDFVTDYKYYCPGVGMVREELEVGGINLIYLEGGPPLENGPAEGS